MDENQSNVSEVSLPGAGGAEPTIIETLNKNTISSKEEEHNKEQKEEKKIESSAEESATQSFNTDLTDEKSSGQAATEQKPAEASTEQSQPCISNQASQIEAEPLQQQEQVAPQQHDDNILNIQSHLIETFDNNFSISEVIDTTGVAVKEIPANPEEFQRVSQIETETSPKSVIEIEPSIPQVHRPIELDLDLSSNKRRSRLSNSFDEEDNIVNTQQTNNSIETSNRVEEVKEEEEKEEIKEEEKEVRQVKEEEEVKGEKQVKQEEIKSEEIEVKTEAKEINIEISDKFIANEKQNIESSHIENNNLPAQTDDNTSDRTSNQKDINENLIAAEKHIVEQVIIVAIPETEECDTDLINNHKVLKQQQQPQSKPNLAVIEEDSVLSSDYNCNPTYGINGLINCLTPIEEEEKKRLLDSLPQLDENIDPHKLSIEAKKEYYQSLRDYLDKYQYDKPPVPLQTYRWEDLRRAKEKGGYPWTHLYKRPLGAQEEPEIVLLLRQSQEFNFHKQQNLHHHNHQASESPKSLKKVRIHDQVLVKETERYISDLSDTEDISSKASSPSSLGLSTTESEEDNKSALSESCASDSVSEGKKSKFQKLKGILKRKTGDKRNKTQAKKSKESIVGKESTESKETATISSASPSPSPLPSDLLDSSDIVSDEYLTATTTESEAQESEQESKSEQKTKPDESSPKKGKCCHPIMDKIKTMADKQFKKRNIKKIPLKGDEKIVLEEEQKILKLRESPKADRGEIPKFIEKQDSEDIVEIMQLEESPSLKRKEGAEAASILIPDEIIQIPTQSTVKVQISQDRKVAETAAAADGSDVLDSPPKKTLRKMKEHVYEEIDSNLDITEKIDEILQLASVEALKQSLAAQDRNILKDIEVNKNAQLDRMGSSEEDFEKQVQPKMATLAPISSIDSTSSDEQEKRISLSTVAEESDAGSIDIRSSVEQSESIKVITEEERDFELKPALKKEPSPGPFAGDKKVTFSHVEDESEPLREDLEVPEAIKDMPNRWKDMSDHEYEPIGEPQDGSSTQETSILKRESTPQPSIQISQPKEVEKDIKASAEAAIEQLQQDLEEKYFSSATTTPRSDSRADTEIHTSQVDTSALEELPLKAENRRKGFMASAQDRSRRFKAGISNQAGKMKTKVRGIKKPTFKRPTILKKETITKTQSGDVVLVSSEVVETQTMDDAPSAEPQLSEQYITETSITEAASLTEASPTEPKPKKRFRAPDFSNIKMPDMPKFKSPDMSKFKAKATDLKKMEFKKPEFKRPEFTKVDMSKFKIPEKFSSLKLKRSKSFKEAETTAESGTTLESGAATQEKTAPKKKFEFNFGTYPRALRRKKIRDSMENIVKPTDISTQLSTETQPSVESSQPPVQRGTRDTGPVGSRWADKFSDVSYGGDSESGRFQRYGSEIESFDRESSIERRMKDDLIAQEDAELAMVGDPSRKQYVDFDEENREIHKISRDREEEFKHRRPMIHQDSNISEESRDVGWSEKDASRNKMLRRAELESEGYSNNYPSEDRLTNQETQSTGSSTFKKGVIEEIDDDEFFLRKRGISQDNIEIRKYISSAIREGFDNPINALQQLGSSQGEYPDSMIGVSSDNVDFGYNIPRTPPRKPKRHHKQRYNDLTRGVGDSQDISQEYDIEQKENYGDNISLPQTGDDFFKSVPDRPLRKSKKGFSQDSQSDIPYFEDINKDFYRDKEINLEDPNMMLQYNKYDADEDLQFEDMSAKPVAPKRRKKRQTRSEDKDLMLNGFGGRSVSNSYLQENIQNEDMIVYRTEHEYVIPLAKPESYEGTPDMNDGRSASRTNNEDDDRTSRGADSFLDEALVIMENEDNEQKFKIEMEESNGYAVVRKEPPPRPPPPSRHHKKSPGRFATMPLPRKSPPPPERPKRNYSTIAPARPPRKQSSLEDLNEPRMTGSDVTEYEELDIDDNLQRRPESPRKLKSGEIINKMKHRPLPPPPRPPREKRDKSKHKSDREDFDDQDAERSRAENAFEVEISTQTDPLPDDFEFEEFEITDDMKVIEPRNSKTLEDMLKDEDKEMENVKWNGADENLTRGLQRFRESTQRSFSEKSRASSAADRSKSLSRPQTPGSIVVEKRVPTPIPNSRTNETMLEASLTVQPLEDDEEIDEYKTSPLGGGSLNDSASYQASTVKSVGEQSAEGEEERLNDFSMEEQLAREEEEREKLREEMRRIQLEKEEEEERLIMEKIRELQQLEEEEERRTLEKLKELEVLEQQEKRRLQKMAEEEERKLREEQDRRIIEKIKELEQQEEEDRRIMEKLKQLEQELTASEESEKRREQTQDTQQPSEVLEQEYEMKLHGNLDALEVPSRPPRKRSSVPNIAEDDHDMTPVENSALSPITESPAAQLPSVSQAPVLTNHMALADLEVERLRVHALQAGHIMVSNLHGNQIGVDELDCKAANLVVRNLELPPGFIEEIVERVRSTERTHVQVETQTIEAEVVSPKGVSASVEPHDTRSSETQTQEQPHRQTQIFYEQRPFIPEDLPPRPPLPSMFPSEYMHSIPPASFYQLRNPDEEEYQPNLQAPRRRRHYRRRDSSSDDDHHRRRSRSRRSPEPTVAQLGGQFLQACGTSLLERLTQIANAVRLNVKDGGERNIGILIAMFILMTVGFLLMAMSGKNIHHHHWDFFNPPNNEGRRQ